jgi:type III secretion system FlhB-like substrate exporter
MSDNEKQEAPKSPPPKAIEPAKKAAMSANFGEQFDTARDQGAQNKIHKLTHAQDTKRFDTAIREMMENGENDAYIKLAMQASVCAHNKEEDKRRKEIFKMALRVSKQLAKLEAEANQLRGEIKVLRQELDKIYEELEVIDNLLADAENGKPDIDAIREFLKNKGHDVDENTTLAQLLLLLERERMQARMDAAEKEKYLKDREGKLADVEGDIAKQIIQEAKNQPTTEQGNALLVEKLLEQAETLEEIANKPASEAEIEQALNTGIDASDILRNENNVSEEIVELAEELEDKTNSIERTDLSSFNF